MYTPTFDCDLELNEENNKPLGFYSIVACGSGVLIVNRAPFNMDHYNFSIWIVPFQIGRKNMKTHSDCAMEEEEFRVCSRKIFKRVILIGIVLGFLLKGTFSLVRLYRCDLVVIRGIEG